MSSAMYVCYDCRTSRRYREWAQVLRKCQFCGKTMGYVFHKIEMPKKEDRRGWKEFELFVRKFNKSVTDHHLARLRKEINKLGRQQKMLHAKDKKGNSDILNEIEKARLEMEFWVEYCA